MSMLQVCSALDELEGAVHFTSGLLRSTRPCSRSPLSALRGDLLLPHSSPLVQEIATASALFLLPRGGQHQLDLHFCTIVVARILLPALPPLLAQYYLHNVLYSTYIHTT